MLEVIITMVLAVSGPKSRIPVSIVVSWMTADAMGTINPFYEAFNLTTCCLWKILFVTDLFDYERWRFTSVVSHIETINRRHLVANPRL